LPGGSAGKTASAGMEILSNGDPPSLMLWGVEEGEEENKRRELGLLVGGVQARRSQIERWITNDHSSGGGQSEEGEKSGGRS